VCQRPTLHQKEAFSGAFGCFFTLITAGLFLPFWLLADVAGLFRPYRCQVCGKASRPSVLVCLLILAGVVLVAACTVFPGAWAWWEARTQQATTPREAQPVVAPRPDPWKIRYEGVAVGSSLTSVRLVFGNMGEEVSKEERPTVGMSVTRQVFVWRGPGGADVAGVFENLALVEPMRLAKPTP
jgi:hypothetical protein